MSRVLLCWLGNTDLNAADGDQKAGSGPIANAAMARSFDEVVILDDRGIGERYAQWLAEKVTCGIHIRRAKLGSPTHYGDIYAAAMEVVAWALAEFGKASKLTFHLSSGTPPMAAIWIIMAKTRFEADLIESSREAGVKSVEVPFELAAELVPAAVRRNEENLERLGEGFRPGNPEFSDIKHRSSTMKHLLAKAEQAAQYNVPVLIQGESGTGKELLAHAIHRTGSRAKKPFLPVNCGAIPRELVESAFFGHRKGAFTGADREHAGYFEVTGTPAASSVGRRSRAC